MTIKGVRHRGHNHVAFDDGLSEERMIGVILSTFMQRAIDADRW